ncbi:MAG: substrate-binding domain-containing protein [Acidobacteriota bacterium]|nr:substrate-binding domain-containing protein [Acidobacteriota bacterium]
MKATTLKWTEDFAAMCPSVRFVVKSGALDVMPALMDGSADMAPLAREPLDTEEAAFEKQFGYKPFGIEVGGGAFREQHMSPTLVMFVNEANPISRLTLAQLADAIGTGSHAVHTWGELGAQGEYKDAPINFYTVEPPNGIPHYLELKALGEGRFRSDARIMHTKQATPVMEMEAQAPVDDRFGLSYSYLSFQKPHTKALALAASRSSPFVFPTFETVLNRTYPLSRPIYIWFKKGPGEKLSAAEVEFLRFVLSQQGQQDFVKTGVLLPLPASIVRRELDKLR